jgi:hypothetical protein
VWLLDPTTGAGNQACSRPRVRVGQCAALCSNFSPSIHGNCHRRNIGFRKTDNFVLGLRGLFPPERDLIGAAKNRSANSP